MIKMIIMKYDGHSGVSEHIMKMSDVASQLKGMDMTISKGFLIHFIMTSLPSQFGHFKIKYNTQKDKWKMSEPIAMCVQEEEERLKVERLDMAHLTMASLSKKPFKKGKGKKRKQGNDASKNGQKEENKMQCHFSNKKGHKRRDCYGFKAWLEKKGKTHCLMSYESYLVDVLPNSWWIDISAGIHITNSLQGYLTSKGLSKGEQTITLGNGTKVEIEAIGTLHLILDTGFIMDLIDTIYVPGFTRNLISVPKLDSYGYELKFGNHGVSLFYNSCLVGSGTLRGNLYALNLDYKYLESLLSYHVHESSRKRNRVNENSSILWHKILGHISREIMEHLVIYGILVSLYFSDFNICVEYIEGKYTKIKKNGVSRARIVRMYPY